MERMPRAPTTLDRSGNWRTVNGSPFSTPILKKKPLRRPRDNSGRQFREFASRFVKRQVWRPTTSRFVDLLHVSLILSEKENAGEPQWLRVQHFARKVLETP